MYSTSDLAALAAAYAYGIATTQSFIEGNKRTSAVVASLFLALNGAELTASEAEIVQIWSELGAGNLSEDALTDWFRERMTKISAAARRRRRSRTGRARR